MRTVGTHRPLMATFNVSFSLYLSFFCWLTPILGHFSIVLIQMRFIHVCVCAVAQIHTHVWWVRKNLKHTKTAIHLNEKFVGLNESTCHFGVMAAHWPVSHSTTMCIYLHITTNTDETHTHTHTSHQLHLLHTEKIVLQNLLNAFGFATMKNSPFDFIQQPSQ